MSDKIIKENKKCCSDWKINFSPKTFNYLNALGLFGAGVAAGASLYIFNNVVPLISQNPPAIAQAEWSALFHSGAKTFPTIGVFNSVLFLLLSKSSKNKTETPVSKGLDKVSSGIEDAKKSLTEDDSIKSKAKCAKKSCCNFFHNACHRKSFLYGLAAVTSIIIIPYTGLFMRHNINSLLNFDVKEALVNDAVAQQLKNLILKWNKLHLVRALFGLISFASAIAASL